MYKIPYQILLKYWRCLNISIRILSSRERAVVGSTGIGIIRTRVCIPNPSLTSWVTLAKHQLASPKSHYSHLYLGGSTSSFLSGRVLWALVGVMHVAALTTVSGCANGWVSSYCCYCGCHCIDSILLSGSRDNVSILSSQPEGSVQSWLSCTLSLATDATRTPSRQSAISSHTLSPR